jgi:general secretion pathway protein J
MKQGQGCYLHYDKNNGFTLLEVLIAIAIFSMISLTSFTIFDSVIRGDETSKNRSERQNELQTAFLIIERDLNQMARRGVRVNGEAASKRFLNAVENADDGENALAFVRLGWTNPGLLIPRSDVQAVAYVLNEETLERLHFNFVDAVVGEEPKIRPLISDVKSIAFEYYDGKKWQEKWDKDDLPLAIAMNIETNDYDSIRRQFLVPGINSSNDKSGLAD